MHRAPRQRLEDQEIECPLQQVERGQGSLSPKRLMERDDAGCPLSCQWEMTASWRNTEEPRPI
jgi:hypothetical protein